MPEITAKEALRFVQENDVKFIRLAFCDLFGVQKNIAIMPGELARALEAGIPFDASAVPGFWGAGGEDLLLIPDPATLSVLPWRPSQGRVVRFYCRICHLDGSPYEGDTRWLLRQAVAVLGQQGYSCRVGAACEFYLFLLDEQGNPTRLPQDRAGYCDIAPLDKGETVRREICLTLEEMGLLPERSHHGRGPGQNEIAFGYDDALPAADNLVTFRAVVKAVAAQHGLYASFLPKPLPEGEGSSLHIGLSLARAGAKLPRQGEAFLQGVLERLGETAAFLNPLPNSYERLAGLGRPLRVGWAMGSRTQPVRVLDKDFSRLEVCSPDPACNPYLVLLLLLQAGLEGILQDRPLLPEGGQGAGRLPESLLGALQAARASDFLRRALPEPLVAQYLDTRERECQELENAVDAAAFEEEQFFPYI
ncbi:MAG: glutamine synthetase [Oscillospiraceae bacterium]|jgi:glutamine synthetase|nr:glutamine synthetase [Oscillospiraceae bacterium]